MRTGCAGGGRGDAQRTLAGGGGARDAARGQQQSLQLRLAAVDGVLQGAGELRGERLLDELSTPVGRGQ